MDIKREADRLKIEPFAPRVTPTPIPSPGPFETPTRCLTINAAWASHVIGCLHALEQEDTWIGTDTEIEQAIQAVHEIINQLSTECA